MGSGPARCKKCARGYRLKGAKCLGGLRLLLYFLLVMGPFLFLSRINKQAGPTWQTGDNGVLEIMLFYTLPVKLHFKNTQNCSFQGRLMTLTISSYVVD